MQENVCIGRTTTDTMLTSLKPGKDSYNEDEASELLGISRDRLHLLLDQNVFNDGSGKPSNINFRVSDLVLLEFWDRSTPNTKVMRMPNRVPV
jgi:hypothetical protein